MRWGLALGVVILSCPSVARATPCGHPDLVETVPADGASGVPINAGLSARYVATAEYLNEPITLEHIGGETQPTSATFDANEGLLTVVPPMPLIPSEMYRISWPALRGLTTAALGKAAVVTFTAGTAEDTAAPEFSGVRSLAWDVERPKDECTDTPEDRYRFDIGLGDVSDDGGRDMLTVVVFQTSGPRASGGSPEPVLLQRMPEPGQEVHVRRAIGDAVGRVCFAALVRDSLGRVSNSTDREVCTTTVKPPFFYGCAIARPHPGSRTSLFAGVALAIMMQLRRGRWRRRAYAACLAVSSCGQPGANPRHDVPVAAQDRTESCADLTESRICWDTRGECPNGICVAPRPVPSGRAPSPLGWRCRGRASERVCVDRRKGVGTFIREGESWVQRYPRLPDDGEWRCDEMGGATVCSGGDAPAGVAINIADAAWICGARRGPSSAPTAERVCVDFSPDFPDGRAQGWRCRYASERGFVRICDRDRNAHQLDDTCDRDHPCLDGLHCIERRCVPERPEPSCAFDRDCAMGACRLGTCRDRSP